MWKKASVFLLLSISSTLLAHQIGHSSYQDSHVEGEDFADYIFGVSIGASIEVSSAGTTYATSGDEAFENHRHHYRKAQNFISDNMDSLAVDIAQGDGEYLDNLIGILEIKDKEPFKVILQNNFEQLYSKKDISSQELLDQILLI
jgi:hypothetical protein